MDVQQTGKFGAPKLWCPWHQNSGAPTFFWGLFPLLRACLCWQCSDKIRKYRGHIETVIKEKDPEKKGGAPEFWRLGTRTLVPQMFLTDFMCLVNNAVDRGLRGKNVENLKYK